MRLAAMGIAILTLGIFSSAGAQADCPPGSRKVKVFTTGKFRCQRPGSLDTRSLRPRPLRAPGAPKSPAAPEAPPVPEAPRKAPAPASAKGDCGLQRWGCEEACRQTYLNETTASGSPSAQRAKVKFGACLRVCGQQFPCKVKAPQGVLK